MLLENITYINYKKSYHKFFLKLKHYMFDLKKTLDLALSYNTI